MLYKKVATIRPVSIIARSGFVVTLRCESFDILFFYPMNDRMAQRKGKFSFRNLTKSQLGGVVFGCTKNTIKECLSKQLFGESSSKAYYPPMLVSASAEYSLFLNPLMVLTGLPYNHIPYVQKIDTGLPLFLFNYSDRTLHGIFEAAGSGQLNIDPYGWTSDGSERTSYPAQVPE